MKKMMDTLAAHEKYLMSINKDLKLLMQSKKLNENFPLEVVLIIIIKIFYYYIVFTVFINLRCITTLIY
jgi:hypothetical protein